ncbi:MAG: hypothetical protein IID41_12780 [Planctomycetes bacterium]|nr:hypothetical protein [Planctomycetota bacterium]
MASETLDIDTLQAALPDSTPAFQILCLKQGYTLPQAKDAWMNELRKANTAVIEKLRRKRAELEQLIKTYAAELAELRTLAKDNLVLDPVDDGPAGGSTEHGSAREHIETLVAEQIKLGKSAAAAYEKVMQENPELREAFVDEHNARYGRRSPDGVA